MQLRWHVKRNKVTVQTIKDYQAIHGCGIIQAKNNLMNQTQELEYYDEKEELWKVVPTVITETIPDLEEK